MATEFILSYTAQQIDEKLHQIDLKANSTEIPTKTSELINDSAFLTTIPSEYVTETELISKGYLTSYIETDPTVPSWAKGETKPSYTKSEVGLGNVDNVKQYSADNPPPYPITSVNGKTGEVALNASDIGALPEDTVIPSIEGLVTESYVSTALNSFLQTVYPVGSIYLSTKSTSPASLFGGTWERIKDTFLLGAGSTYSAGSTGGEATHTLAVKEIPSLTGKISFHGKYLGTQVSGTSGVFSDGTVISDMYASVTKTTGANSLESIKFDNGGKGQAHNNMPPYLTVYMWKRIS